MHAPDEQICPLAQTLPHEPQLNVSVCRLTHAPPQFVWPDGQPAVVQVPLAQTCPEAHTWPHDPQLFGSDCALAHTPPQNTWPDTQAHAPFTQTCPPEHP